MIDIYGILFSSFLAHTT